MRHATLCYLRKNRNILLGMKKKGFGAGKLNGIGGKIEPGESPTQAAVRELFEETGIIADASHARKIAELTFLFPFDEDSKWNQVVHVFQINEWSGEPQESDEMKPVWIEESKIPYHEMWSDDKHWLPLVLSGKHVKAKFVFRDSENIENYELDSDAVFDF